MKCTIPEISWHNRDPVLAVDIQPTGPDGVCRLATAGTDSHVVIWQLRVLENGGVSVEALCDLTRHTRAVNAVRFSPNGEYLASADDEGAVILWRRQEGESLGGGLFEEGVGEGGENKEHWGVAKLLRGHLEDVYDVAWSRCSQFLISGSVDNSAILWDAAKGKSTALLSEHKGFVQGVTWDPLGQLVSTLCSDRVCRVYNISSKKILHRIYKASLPTVDEEENITEKPTRLFYDDTLKSFCRRLSFSPDGELLLAPSGILENEAAPTTNGTYVFIRSNPSKPVLYLPTKDKYTLAVRFCPLLFKLKPIPQATTTQDQAGSEEYSNTFRLPYRMIFAVATQNAVLLYDTQQTVPFAKLSNIHYTRLTDIAWSSDGRLLVVSSTDGYCSLVSFTKGELGEVYQAPTSATDTTKKQAEATDKANSEKHKKAEKDSAKETVKVTPKDKGKDATKKVETESKKENGKDKAKDVNKKVDKEPEKDTGKDRAKDTEMEVANESKIPTPTEATSKKPMVIRRAGDGKRVSLITLSGPGHKSDDRTKSEPSIPPTQPQQDGVAEMEVDEETKERFESASTTTTPNKTTSTTTTPNKTTSSTTTPNKTTSSTTTPNKTTTSTSESLPSPTPTPTPSQQDPSPSRTPGRNPRRVSLITLSSPKGKKGTIGDLR